DLGYSEEEVKAFAATYQVQNEEPNDQGEMFMRPGRDSDRFPLVFPNEQAARAANGGAYPPDLSLMTKAREGGPEYVHALMVGYQQAPSDFKLLEGLYYNAYFPGHQIAMPTPLNAGQVTYADGTEASVDQMAKDVTAFLMWTAEPKMEARKAMGIKVMLFLLVATGLLIAVKKRIWRNMH
ncbi:MAG: cytochrome c1, partial [Alphaproteobacteria bacterium]